MDMGELLPECWGVTGEGKSGPLHRRTRVVADIFSWIQCFTSYVSVQGSQYPEAIPELMAYMAMIVRSSQHFKDLAWLWYDVGFRRQAALTKNRKWSQINTTLYSMCFTTSFRGGVSRCELCLGSMRSMADCALQGDPDPDMRDRVKAVDATLLALASRQWRQAGDQPTQRANQVCRLFNLGRCNFAKCKYIYECLQCRGLHPVSRCQRRGPSGGRPGGLPPAGRLPFQKP